MAAYITRNVASVITVTLQRRGVTVAIADHASVIGQFYPMSGDIPVSPELRAFATDDGASWHTGVVALTLQASDTTLLPDACLLYLSVDDGTAQEEWWVRFNALDAADLLGTALFPDRTVALENLRAQLRSVEVLSTQVCGLSNEYLWERLRAAEADAERSLKTYFGAVSVLPETADDQERAALEAAGTRWIEEPGYDFEPDFFSGERWGMIMTRHRPIIDVDSLRFVYPQPMATRWELPHDWIRLDKKYGMIRLVPGSQAFAAPLSAWSMQVLGGGRTIPQMIQIRYRTGLLDPARNYPDLVDLVQRMAVLRVMNNQFPASSSSISADGLSQSQSINLANYQNDIDARLEKLRQALFGVRSIVL